MAHERDTRQKSEAGVYCSDAASTLGSGDGELFADAFSRARNRAQWRQRARQFSRIDSFARLIDRRVGAGFGARGAYGSRPAGAGDRMVRDARPERRTGLKLRRHGGGGWRVVFVEWDVVPCRLI